MKLVLPGTTILFATIVAVTGCGGNDTSHAHRKERLRLVVLDPGHFHAALMQRSMYDQIDPEVHVYAPDSAEAKAYLDYITQYNTRKEQPTAWKELVYAAPDFLKRAGEEKSGGIAILAGNNRNKAGYISTMVSAGLHVLADKPMAIDRQGFEQLRQSMDEAAGKKLMLCDIMTSRYDIVNVIQKKLFQDTAVFGRLLPGTADRPSVVSESVHHFYKTVSGKPLLRPAWYFDVQQQGEGITDVTTHLIDLIHWTGFSDQPIDYKTDIVVGDCRHWPTVLSAEQFRKVTGQPAYPAFLNGVVKDSSLPVLANGEINYAIKNIFARVKVSWEFAATEGAGDTHYAVFRGTACNLVTRQDKREAFRPVLYIEPAPGVKLDTWERSLQAAIESIAGEYPGVSLEKEEQSWKLLVPDRWVTGHEQQFSSVVKKYLEYLEQKQMPAWERSALLAKYYITTAARERCRIR